MRNLGEVAACLPHHVLGLCRVNATNTVLLQREHALAKKKKIILAETK